MAEGRYGATKGLPCKNTVKGKNRKRSIQIPPEIQRGKPNYKKQHPAAQRKKDEDERKSGEGDYHW